LALARIGIVYWLIRYYSWKVNIWVVTNFRVIDESGLMNHFAKESPLDKINYRGAGRFPALAVRQPGRADGGGHGPAFGRRRMRGDTPCRDATDRGGAREII